MEVNRENYIAVHNSIEQGLEMAGRGLLRMRNERLYFAAGYPTFDAYLKVLHMSTRSAYREIERFVTMQELANIGTKLSLSKSQIDALSKVRASNRRVTIDAALALTDLHGDNLTSKRIEHVGNVIDGMVATGSLDLGDGESTPLLASVALDEIERIERQAEHIRSRNTRCYHARNVPGYYYDTYDNGKITFDEPLEIEDGERVFVSFWSERQIEKETKS